jgi:hypothetical protein
MQLNEIIEVLNRPISRELLARDVTRLPTSRFRTKTGNGRPVVIETIRPALKGAASQPGTASCGPSSRMVCGC